MTGALRYPVSLLAGLAFTAAMFGFLSALINVDFEAMDRKAQTRIEFTRLLRDSDV